MIVIHLLLLMARKGLYSASGPTKAKITKQPGKKKSNIATASLKTLKKVQKKTRVKYSHAKKTCGNYNGHFCHGQKFFAELVSDICSTLLSPPRVHMDSSGLQWTLYKIQPSAYFDADWSPLHST